jgi:GR25 family glycosyltransferase involved in LPS biosynthesis
MKIDKYFYVNMDDQTERKSFMENQILKSKILTDNITRYPAIDGRKIDLNNISYSITRNAINDLHKSKHDYPGLQLTIGALGFWYTHISILKMSIDLNETLLILDDDVYIKNSFDTDLDNVLSELPEDFDFCYLSRLNIDNQKKQYSKHLHIPIAHIFGPNGYIVSPNGSKKILNHIFPISCQMDTRLIEIQEHINFYASNDNLVYWNNNIKSTIQLIK